MIKCLVLAGAVITATNIVLPSVSKASDWGCEVLLCLSGDWKGTPSCHPPIYKLIAAMKVPGFSWPTCPQANSSGAHKEQYYDCAEGFAVSNAADSDKSHSNGAMCVAKVGRNEAKKEIIRDPNQPKGGTISYGSPKLGVTNGFVTTERGTKIPVNIKTISNSNGISITGYEYSYDRERREKPWYIEYDDANGKRQRSWFNLDL